MFIVYREEGPGGAGATEQQWWWWRTGDILAAAASPAAAAERPHGGTALPLLGGRQYPRVRPGEQRPPSSSYCHLFLKFNSIRLHFFHSFFGLRFRLRPSTVPVPELVLYYYFLFSH